MPRIDTIPASGGRSLRCDDTVPTSLPTIFLFGLALIGMLAGCDTNSTAATVAADEPTYMPTDVPTYDYLGGYLYGTLSLDDAASSTYPIQVIMTEDAQFRATQYYPYSRTPGSSKLFRGSFSLVGHSTIGEGVAITDLGETWSDGQSVSPMLFSGTLDKPTTSSDGRLLISVSLASGDTGRIDAVYDVNSGYNQGVSPEWLTGTWAAAQDADGSYAWDDPSTVPVSERRWMIINFGSNGDFVGEDTDGCTLAGQFSPIHPRSGAWSVEYTQSECGRAGTYAGLMLYGIGWWEDSSFSISADDGEHLQVLEFRPVQ